MANEAQGEWLVETDKESHRTFAVLEDAIEFMSEHQGPLLYRRHYWQPAFDFNKSAPPPKKRPRKKRNSSPASGSTETAAPAANAAPKAGDVPAPAPSSPVKAVLPCGGTRCRDKGGIVVHDVGDLGCTHMHPGKRARA